MNKLTPALKKETVHVARMTGIGLAVMYLGFLAGHFLWPDYVPFDYRVILGGLGGSAVAVLNFFLMGLTVQKVVDTPDEDLAKNRMRASYTQRTLLQMAWVVIAIVVPCFQFVAGILPLLFPSLGIKLGAVIPSRKKGGDSNI